MATINCKNLSITPLVRDDISEHCIENRVNNIDSSNNLVIDVDRQTKKFMIGDRIEHPKFGKGYVLNLQGNDDLEKIEINFDFLGRKWLILSCQHQVKVSKLLMYAFLVKIKTRIPSLKN